MTGNQTLDKKIRLGFFLNTGFAGFELLAGFSTGSLALISDAVHNLTDSMTLAVSFLAEKIAQKKPNHEHTFGYGKARILGAMFNSLLMFALVALILRSAWQRWQNPQTVSGGWIAAVAFVGIIINGSVAALFYQHRRDLNVKAAFLNMAFDALVSLAAMISGIVIYFTRFEKLDALVAVFVGIMMAIAFGRIINEATHIVLEGAPEGLNSKEILADLKNFPLISGVDNFHLWTISSGRPALSCHLVVKNAAPKDLLLLTEEVKKMLASKYKIGHTAIELGSAPTPEHEH